MNPDVCRCQKSAPNQPSRAMPKTEEFLPHGYMSMQGNSKTHPLDRSTEKKWGWAPRGEPGALFEALSAKIGHFL
eukprot:1160968-Pelagomonas_calceolata.AAC.6